MVALWDLTDPAHPQRIGQPLTGHTGSVCSVAFAPDGHTLATVSDGTAMLWDLTHAAQPQQIGQPLVGHTKAVLAVAFAPDGYTLATGSADQTVILWDLAGLISIRDHTLQLACVRTAGALDPGEWSRLVPGLPYEDSCAIP
jgi:WD40 repeat protein